MDKLYPAKAVPGARRTEEGTLGARRNYLDIYAADRMSDSKYFLTLPWRKCVKVAGAPAAVPIDVFPRKQ